MSKHTSRMTWKNGEKWVNHLVSQLMIQLEWNPSASLHLVQWISVLYEHYGKSIIFFGVLLLSFSLDISRQEQPSAASQSSCNETPPAFLQKHNANWSHCNLVAFTHMLLHNRNATFKHLMHEPCVYGKHDVYSNSVYKKALWDWYFMTCPLRFVPPSFLKINQKWVNIQRAKNHKLHHQLAILDSILFTNLFKNSRKSTNSDLIFCIQSDKLFGLCPTTCLHFSSQALPRRYSYLSKNDILGFWIYCFMYWLNKIKNPA